MSRVTKRFVDSIKPPEKGEAIYWDDELKGFAVRVWPSGMKSYLIHYRTRSGRQRKMSLGRHGVLTPGEARSRAVQLLGEIAGGADPMGQREKGRNEPTFALLADEYIKRHASQKRSGFEDVRIIEKDVLPKWGGIPAKEIRRRDVVRLINAVKDRGAPIAANRTLALVRKIFNFGIDQDIVESNPCSRIKPPGKEGRRDRVLKDHEIEALWKMLPNTDISAPIQAALMLVLATAQRPGEVLGVEWSEVDLNTGWWTIPAEKSKNGLPHRVFLSPLALRILESLDRNGRYMFPSPKNRDEHIEVGALGHALWRNRGAFGMERFTPHDLRRTAASLMASIGVPWVTISKILNHKIPGPTSIYVRHGFDREKQEALMALSERLEHIISRKKAAVIPLAR